MTPQAKNKVLLDEADSFQKHRYSTRIALGVRLKDWRHRKGQKISDVAVQLGVSTATWGHWETGEHLPSGDLLLALEQLTGMPLHVLFCPHMDVCPQLRSGRAPQAFDVCCQCGPAQSRQDAPDACSYS